jgi:hypothetical protein
VTTNSGSSAVHFRFGGTCRLQLSSKSKPSKKGRVIAQTVSRRLHTAVARVRAHLRSCGGQNGTRLDFHRVLRFPLPILIPPTITRSWYNRPISGRRTEWAQSHLNRRNKKILNQARSRLKSEPLSLNAAEVNPVPAVR